MEFFTNTTDQRTSLSPGAQNSTSPQSRETNSSVSPPPVAVHNVAPPQAAAASSAPRIRRRNRMITSCLECRRRKLKCNKSHPCLNCQKFSRDCVFLAPALDQASQLKLTEIKEKVGSLERLLERDVAKNANSSSSHGSPSQDRALPDESEDFIPANEDERDLEPTPLATADAAYEVDGDDDDLLDLGIMLGKMRITERIGGFFRPRISEEVGKMSDAGALEYTISDDPQEVKSNPDDRRRSSSLDPIHLPPASEWLKPSPSYITPSSGFFFGSGPNPGSLIDFLPSRLAADRLIKQYFTSVHPICQILHRPTFEREYDTFWDEVTLGVEPPNSVQTIVFAAMFNGVVSMEEEVIIRDFGVSKASLLDNFKLGTETALSRANFLRTTKIETLQAFVMYLIPLCRAELSRAHSVLVGAAIRMAECMGLHRDGETYGMNPLETHVRRLIWHQLCFLDIRTCEAQGPRPTIRREEFDTKLPINADDVDFHSYGPPPVPADRWTDATLCLIRFEVNEMMRTIWIDRPRIESRKISLTAVLSKIETFRTKMAAKYDHLIDDRVPIQRCGKVIKTLLIPRLHIMVLHRYHNSVVSPMPERLRNIMLGSGTTTLEMAVHLDTSLDLKQWKWYGGALQQYHIAFLLLMEVYVHPHRKGADRIWASLDYIFECDPNDTQHIKGKKILSELQQKTAVYQSMRGTRAPINMTQHLPQRAPRLPDSNYREQNLKFIGTSTRGEDVMVGKTISSPPIVVEAAPFVGKVPVAQVQFAGVSNGESLWALPGQKSPEAEGSAKGESVNVGGVGDVSLGAVYDGAVPGQGGLGLSSNVGSGPAPGGQLAEEDDLMADIDWDAFDALFPPGDQNLLTPALQQYPGSAGSYF